MSIVLTQSSLLSIGMNGGGPQKRRSARLSQEADAENEPPSKRTKVSSSSITTAVGTKQRDDDNSKAIAKRKRKVYDEEVEGFAFTKGGRGKDRDPKEAPLRDASSEEKLAETGAPAAPVEASAPEPRQPELATDDTAPKTTQRKTRRRLPATPDRNAAESQTRRSKRLSGDKGPEAAAQQITGRSPERHSHVKSHENVDRGRSPSLAKVRPVTVEKKRKYGARGVEEEKVMTISLPFADTPIIRRNREMRKNSAEGHRRSSAGMRGRRVSSLIDEGRGHEASAGPPIMMMASGKYDGRPHERHPVAVKNPRVLSLFADAYPIADEDILHVALPHSEVPAFDFFKHISADLTEPRRMRCLLGWCGTRTLPPKPDSPKETTPAASLDFQARKSARAIQEVLSQDLVAKGALSDWFSRDESAAPPVSLRKRPNPRNLTNAAKAEELERELERLKKERTEWDEVVQSAACARPDGEYESLADGEMSPLQPDALDILQRTIYEQLQPLSGDVTTDAANIQLKLRGLSEDLEFAVDQFAHGMHALSTTKQTAERVAERALAEAALALEEKDKQRVTSKPVDQMESLRGLARALHAQHNL